MNVEVKTPADLTIPGEILPLGYRPSGTDIGEWARKLTAFRAVVRTTLTEPRDSTTQTTPESAGDDAGLIDQEHVLYGAPELPLLFLWDPSAPASALTRDLLESHRAAERILLDGPYPAADAHNEPESLAALLVDPPQVHTSSVRGITPYQIVHVNTHATVGRRASIRAFSEFHLAYYAKERGLLRRSRPLRVPVVVTNAHLTAAFDEVRYRARNRSRGNAPLRSRGPVAFFNACGAVASPEHGAAAFVNSFLSFGYRAVIGPRVDVPGILAHQMWEGFLKSLLNHRPVGLALYDARAGLLYAENTKNPLGALMTLYGEANLALRPALEP